MSKRKKRGWERLTISQDEASALLRRMMAEGKLPNTQRCVDELQSLTPEELEVRLKEAREMCLVSEDEREAILQRAMAMRDQPLVFWAPRK